MLIRQTGGLDAEQFENVRNRRHAREQPGEPDDDQTVRVMLKARDPPAGIDERGEQKPVRNQVWALAWGILHGGLLLLEAKG